MKKWLAFLLIIMNFLPLFAWQELDYSQKINWLICEQDKKGTAFDLFYVYPTLSNKKDATFLDRNDPEVMKKVLDFVTAQTGYFASDARIFAPFIRQLEYQPIASAMAELPKKDPDFMTIPHFREGVNDVRRAFRFYRRHFRKGRPFVFVGHSQGAMELYELLKMDTQISVASGFVAAYLIGLPRVTPLQMLADFKMRGITPAKNADDIGVIVVWNTQSKDCTQNPFTTEGGYCINPLSWKIDAAPMPASKNEGAFFYDYRNNNTSKKPKFCGAVINSAKGALIVDLPSDSEWDAKGMMGKGVFHMNDIWFFAENMRLNIQLRVKQYIVVNKETF